MNISAYFTTRNCIQMGYPLERSIRSVFGFCNEVVVCDTSDGTDGTEELLLSLKEEFEALHGDNLFKIVTNPECDWTAPNSGIYDGLNKAFARAQCTNELCWQQDVDEVASENVSKEWLVKFAQKTMFGDGGSPVIAFPVVEPWGPNGKIRCDISPTKERLSVNHPNITHGIPSYAREFKDGLLYSKPAMSDGCNLINKNSNHPVAVKQVFNCFNPKVFDMEMAPKEFVAIQAGAPFSPELNTKYEKWFNGLIDKVPFIWHYSWYDIGSKIKKYQLFWARSWDTLYGQEKNQEPGFPFFNKHWDEVTDSDIKETAEYLEKDTGGWIFHSRYDNKDPRLSIKINKKVPKP